MTAPSGPAHKAGPPARRIRWQCPLWVNNGHSHCRECRPLLGAKRTNCAERLLLPQQRTSCGALRMSSCSQKETFAREQFLAVRLKKRMDLSFHKRPNWIVFRWFMIVAVKGDKAGIGEASRHFPALFNRLHPVPLGMEHQTRRFNLGKQFNNIQAVQDFTVFAQILRGYHVSHIFRVTSAVLCTRTWYDSICNQIAKGGMFVIPTSSHHCS
jgi:hypothetical protein